MIKIKTWIPSILAGVLIAVEVALNLPSLKNISIPVSLAFVSLIVQIVILDLELREIKLQKPNIVFDEFKLEPPFHIFRDGQPKERIERYYIMFRNTKLPGKPICDTKPVHAIVTFYNTNCEVINTLSHEEPFWLGISGPPWERSNNFSIIIKASSKPEGICLIARQQGGSDLFVFCDKSYIPNFRSLEPFQDSLRIPFNKFFVRIQLKSENLDMKPIWVSITNRTEREQPLFEVIEPPCDN